MHPPTDSKQVSFHTKSELSWLMRTWLVTVIQLGNELEVLAHTIGLMYKAHYMANDQVSQCFNQCTFFTAVLSIPWILPRHSHIENNEVDTRSVTEKMLVWGHRRVYDLCSSFLWGRADWDAAAESLQQLAVATWRIILFVFIRTRVGM